MLEKVGSSVVAPPVPMELHADRTIGRSMQRIIRNAYNLFEFFIFVISFLN